MKITFHRDAQAAFSESQAATIAAATPVLELLSSGFQVTWFREIEANIWVALIKPSPEIGNHFGLAHECFVIGNGYTNDFHQKTLRQEPPSLLKDRIDSGVRFVASDAPIAETFCAAWAEQRRATVVVIRPAGISDCGVQNKDRLYALLSASLWRRDRFAEAEPVRDPSEFFGRALVVNELYAKIIAGAPVAVFGLRKIGKSSLLGRLDDLLVQDQCGITATAFLIGNSTRLKAGRWWNMAHALVTTWQEKLQRLASHVHSRVYPKAEAISQLIAKHVIDRSKLASAFEKDIRSLLKAATALKKETDREAVRLIFILDECDHLYPHLEGAGYWKTDFFDFWNTLQAIKRGLDTPNELVFLLGGVNPSGVEQGSIAGQPNPLYETQRKYLGPMPRSEADSLLVGLGRKMGLVFEPKALEKMYEIVGGHPLLLRRLGSAIHDLVKSRSEITIISINDVGKAFESRKRDLFNQVNWFLEHLALVAPDEERLLRDIARGGAQAYAELWGDNEFRETYSYHLQCYGLVHFERELPEIALSLVREALQRPVASEFLEQKGQLREAVEELERAVRIRLRVDLEHETPPEQAIERAVAAIPKEAKNRALSRQDLLELGTVAGLGAVLESMNWGDYEILFDRYHDDISWIGVAMTKDERLKALKAAFVDAHLVRHNNDHKLKEKIDENGYATLYSKLSKIREMLSA